MAWAVGKSKIFTKTPIDKPISVPGESWRTPISHVMSGGGPLEFRVWFPGSATRKIRVVAKAIRLS